MTTTDFTQLRAQLDAERDRVAVASHDFSVRELIRMLRDGELNIAPEYQRKFRWTEDTESIFIESVFLGLPVPPIFVATNDDFRWEVVDGLQRLSSLLHFVNDHKANLGLVERTSPLRLSKLEKLNQLNGCGWDDLTGELQRYFGRATLQVISLTDRSNEDVRFELFERLNAGSIRLSPQEVRACIFRGRYNRFIEEMSKTEDFASLLKLEKSNKSDGTASEEALKYFAYKNAEQAFDGRVTDFLNQYMKTARDTFDYVGEEAVFREASARLRAFCDGGPYVRRGSRITPLVQLEASLVALGRMIEAGQTPLEPSSGWQDDHELRASSGGGSNSRAMLARRVARATELFSGTKPNLA